MGILRTLTARAAPSARLILVAGLATLAMPAPAGDEVDYSAPYITVENGELVTRYPAKAHEKPNDEGNAAVPDREDTAFAVAPGALAVVICLGVAVVLLRRVTARRASRR